MSEYACEVPLHEQLRIPMDARLEYQHNQFSWSMIPVGIMCNAAADEIARLRVENRIREAERNRAQQACEQMGRRIAELEAYLCREKPSECINGCPPNQVCDFCQYAPARRIAELEAAMNRITYCVDEQANDAGLWFVATTITEAYLQQGLRTLHNVIEEAALSGGGAE